MKAGDFIEALERFFLDIVGTILPGLALLAGFCYVTGTPLSIVSKPLIGTGSEYEWLFWVALSYIMGHGITSVGHTFTGWLENVYRSELVRNALDYNGDNKEKSQQKWLLDFIQPEQEISQKTEKDSIFLAFKSSLLKRLPALSVDSDQAIKLRSWRSLAMSIAPENSQLIYRFQFIALLNLGVATVSIIVAVLWAALLILRPASTSITVIDFNCLLILLFVAPYFFVERYYVFNRMALQVPFSMALAKLEISREESPKSPPTVIEGTTIYPRSAGPNPLTVYLAGGFQSGWQTTVIQAAPALHYFDPRSHGLVSKAEYTAWDLAAIRRCDCVFAFLESTNPGGYALSLEVGYAKALGKFIIFVDEKSASAPQTSRYLGMVAETADIKFEKLQDGINFLQTFQKNA